MKKSKKRIVIVSVIVAAVLLVIGGYLIFFNLPDDEVEISDDEYKRMLSNIGIEGLESVANDSIVHKGNSSRIPSDAYNYENPYSFTYKDRKELCSEQKDYEFECFYGMGEDEAQANAWLEEYKKYLLEQGFEYLKTDGTYGDIYFNGSYILLISDVYLLNSNGKYAVRIYYY